MKINYGMSIMERSGLLDRKGQLVPLLGVHISADLKGLAVESKVTQRFVNREEVPIEATYLFPLPTDSSVCGFTVQVGERTIEGKVEEREAAFEIYDDAMAEGHGAFLLDQERPNVFHLSVGNVLPGQLVDVQIRLVYEARYEGNSVRLMIPTTISPKYVPGDVSKIEQLEIDRITPPYAMEVPYGLSLEINAELHSKITAVESPSHTVRSEVDGNKCRVTLSQEEAALDRDFVLTIETDRSREAGAMVSEKDGYEHLLLELKPTLDPGSERRSRTVLFLVDCSGSMQGSSIEQARRALNLCIRTLREGDTFQIVRFGSNYGYLFGEPLVFSQESLDLASTVIAKMQADLGGTEILEPLKFITENQQREFLDIVLLTDGQVMNEDQVLKVARKNKQSWRFFTFGIGAGCSEYLVKGLARETGGIAEFIYPGERIEEKVLRQFNRIDSPAVRKVSIDCGEYKTELAPAEIPPVFSGETLTMGVRFEKGVQLPEGTVVTLRGEASGGPVEWKVEVCRIGGDEAIPLVWARNRIRDLEASFGSPRGSRQLRPREGPQNYLVGLSKMYGILSSETSFVGVDKRTEDEQSDTPVELRRVPVAVTTGWHGMGQQTFSDPVMICHSVSMSDSMRRSLHVKQQLAGEAPSRASRRFQKITGRDSLNMYCMGSLESIQPEISGLLDILVKQNGDGSFPLTREVARYCGEDISTLKARVDGFPGLVRKDAKKMVATVYVLRKILQDVPSAKDLWGPGVKKALTWLRKINDPHPFDEVDRLIDEVEKQVEG